MSSTTRRAWIAAVSVGAVQGLKDQGLCRWNSTAPMIRSIHQHCAKKSFAGGPFSRSSKQPLSSSSSSSSAVFSGSHQDQQKIKMPEESFRKVMYLSCWAPY